MTCFVAHMRKKGYFEEIGVAATKENAKDLEHAIAKIVGKTGERCPAIWQETKKWLADPEKKAVLDRELRREFGRSPRT